MKPTNNESFADLRVLSMTFLLVCIMGIFHAYSDSSQPQRMYIMDGSGSGRTVYIDASNSVYVIDHKATNLLTSIRDYLAAGPTNTVNVAGTFNATGSSNVLVSVTNSISSSVGNTVALPVTNASANPLWATLTNSSANIGNVGITNSPGTYIWANLTNSPSVVVANSNTFSFSLGNTVALPVSNSLANPYLWISPTNGTANIGNIGVSNSAGLYLWVGVTNIVPVTQSGTWDEVGINDSGNSITVDGTISSVQSGNWAIAATNLSGGHLAVSNVNNITSLTSAGQVGLTNSWVALTNGTANIGNVGVTNSAGTSLWVGLTNAIPTGANVIGAVTQSGNWAVATTNITGGHLSVSNINGQVGMWAVTATNVSGGHLAVSNINTVAVGQHNVAVIATNSGGYTPFTIVGAATINTNVLKASAGTLGYVSAFNTNAAPRYVVFMNFTTNHTTAVGETDGQKFMIPGYSTNGAGFVISLPPQGLNFSAGIAYGICAGMATNDATAISANEVILNGGYK